mgnify:CR=1 FL=1
MSELFSYSKINTFKNCRELYHINYIQGIRKENENIEAYLGSCVHAVIEDIYNNKNQAINFDDMFEDVTPGPLELNCPTCNGLISITTTQRPIQIGCPMCQSQFVLRE